MVSSSCAGDAADALTLPEVCSDCVGGEHAEELVYGAYAGCFGEVAGC